MVFSSDYTDFIFGNGTFWKKSCRKYGIASGKPHFLRLVRTPLYSAAAFFCSHELYLRYMDGQGRRALQKADFDGQRAVKYWFAGIF